MRLLIRPNLVFLVSTIGVAHGEKYINVAPYSLVMEASHVPPRIVIAIRHNNDTYTNICEGSDFVINVCDERLLEAVKRCSLKVPKGISEIDVVRDMFSITVTPFVVDSLPSQVPGILESPLNVWCRPIEGLSLTYDELCYGEPVHRTLLMGDVLGVVADAGAVRDHLGMDWFDPEWPLLLSHGAGVYGRTSSISDGGDPDYAQFLESISTGLNPEGFSGVTSRYSIPADREFELAHLSFHEDSHLSSN